MQSVASRESKQWMAKLLTKARSIETELRTAHQYIERSRGQFSANDRLRQTIEAAQLGGVNLLADRDELLAYAESQAQLIEKALIGRGRKSPNLPAIQKLVQAKLWPVEPLVLAGIQSSCFDTGEEKAAQSARKGLRVVYSVSGFHFVAGIAEKHGFELPEFTGCQERDTLTYAQLAAQYTCPKWWQRKLIKAARKSRDEALRALDAVGVDRQCYVSNAAAKDHAKQKAANWDYLRGVELENQDGHRVTLAEIAAATTSNPAIRRIEMMVRVRGQEYYAERHGQASTFVTVTAPSAYHPRTIKRRKGKNGKKARYSVKNPSYQGFTVRESQDWMQKVWARCRAELARCKIDYSGIRVVEPHHDGTPHWHLLIHAAPERLQELENVIREQWLSEYENERGAAENRCKIVRIDKEKKNKKGEPCSATGYIAKYISKNIDGYGVGQDNYGFEANSSAQRICAWASTHSIRQFQFFGCPSVTMWRQFRRISNSKELQQRLENHDVDESTGELKLGTAAHWLAVITDLDESDDAAQAFADYMELWATYPEKYEALKSKLSEGEALADFLDKNLAEPWAELAEVTDTTRKAMALLKQTAVDAYCKPTKNAVGVCLSGFNTAEGKHAMIDLDTRVNTWRVVGDGERCEQKQTEIAEPDSSFNFGALYKPPPPRWQDELIKPRRSRGAGDNGAAVAPLEYCH